MVVEHGDIDVVDFGLRFFDGCGGDDFISLLAQDGGAQQQVLFEVVEQENADGTALAALAAPPGNVRISPTSSLQVGWMRESAIWRLFLAPTSRPACEPFLANSGNLLKTATARSQLRFSMAG